MVDFQITFAYSILFRDFSEMFLLEHNQAENYLGFVQKQTPCHQQ